MPLGMVGSLIGPNAKHTLLKHSPPPMRLLPRFYLIILLSFFTALMAQAQSVQLTGRVVNSLSQEPVEYATIVALDKTSEEPLKGTTTNAAGQFTLTVNTTDFIMEVRLLSYATMRFEEFEVIDGKTDLGTIALEPEAMTTDEVVIEGEQSSVEFQLDKRVFNVGQDLASSGGSAYDVLNNVPSVNVNIEGDISLRGSQGVQILINGKPSVLAGDQGNSLGTITADMIERIEVITNPSAKYDAEGTSGIINIVLKKEEKEGTNGSVSLNLGWPHNHSFGMSLNRRANKFNLFTQVGAGYRSLPSYRENINRDLVSGNTIYNDGIEYRNENFYNIILGTDYHIDDYNVITLSGSFAYEIEDQPSQTDFFLVDAENDTISAWQRTEVTEATNPKYNFELQYKRDFRDHEDHDLLFSALGRFFGKDLSSEFQNTTVFGEDRTSTQQTRSNFQEAIYTFKLDYIKPFTDKITLESGAQYVVNPVSNDFAVSDWIDQAWVENPNLTNVFQFDQRVLGVYSTGAYEGDRWGVKLGLRAENTDLNTVLVNTNEVNERNYTNLFPSAHTSYKLNEFVSFQAGYSRRIRRPRLWDLNPFFNLRNNFNIRTGNPNLMPEFTDSYELNSIFVLEGLSLNVGAYHRYTTDVIQRVSTFDDGVTFTTPENVGTDRTTGAEMNAKYTPARWLVLNADANYNYFNRVGEFEGNSFDFNASRWSSELTAKLKLPWDIDLEVSGQYRSPYQTFQGMVSQNRWMDLGIRKKILKGRGIFNIGVRDVFASRIEITETDQPDFYVYSWGQRGRFLTFGFSYGFGKGEAMEYSGRRHH